MTTIPTTTRDIELPDDPEPSLMERKLRKLAKAGYIILTTTEKEQS